MIKLIDNFLNKITMYRLVLYSLILLVLHAVILSIFGVLQFSPYAIIFSTFFIISVCLATNKIFAYIYNVPANSESVYITALILVMIISPIQSDAIKEFFILATSASIISMASKYIFAIKRKHLFNPVAIAAALVALFLQYSASWWVATLSILPMVLVTGILIVRKTKRFNTVASFISVFTLTILFRYITSNSSVGFLHSFYRAFVASPILFFAFFMLTEPLTMPPQKWARNIYGGIVGALLYPFVHIGSIYSTPELALSVGNIFSYLVSPKEKLMLKPTRVSRIARDTYEFSFKKGKAFNFIPGQYLEFTLKDNLPDSRGNRRYFTIASSPTESDLSIGVKYYSNPSSFKTKLINIGSNDTVVAGARSGDFVMPKDKNKKLVFIAGGIGITPFRSMIQFLLDTKQKRDIVLLYSNKTKEDIAYKKIFDQAKTELGLSVIYILTDVGQVASMPSITTRPIDRKLILQNVPDHRERIYYISGPNSMVESFKDMLLRLRIPNSHIKTDFFPGFA